MDIVEKIVEFDKYCPKGKYENLDSVSDPCNECLDNPVNEHSTKPICYEEKEEEETK